MSVNQKRVPKRKGPLYVIKSVFAAIGRLFATITMVGVITGCIVACIMTVYVLRYIGADNRINLDDVPLSYTTFIYATDPDTGLPFEVARLHQGGQNRVWVDFEDINQYTIDALVAIEDRRFWEHQGVDWRRTVSAFANMFIPIYTTPQGGSTITQQLVKNVTLDDDFRVDRKVREIFRALELERHESKENILEAYLNVVSFGNGTNGIQAAANLYFGVDSYDLTLAQAASIVGITQFPGRFNPFTNPENNKNRQEWILYEMYNQGFITRQQHDRAVREPLNFQQAAHVERTQQVQSYFVDFVFEQVVSDLMEQRGYTRSHATNQIFAAGYRIHITKDRHIQDHLENIFLSTDNFPPVLNAIYPQSAAVIMDPHGRILAMVGGIGEKTGDRVLNRATRRRQPGSAIKPVASYAQAFEYDRITWSTMLHDNPILLEEPGRAPIYWPRNHYGTFLGPITSEEAMQRSTNTIPVRLTQQIGERRIFDFMRYDLGIDSLVDRQVIAGAVHSDINLSSMALGGMTFGVTPLELTAAYQIFANGGYFTRPYAYTEVRDANGRLILQADTTRRRVISEDTSVVMNRLLQRVVTTPPGTGQRANLPGVPTAGKTGTSSGDVDQWFIGMTPHFVAGVWMGFDERLPENNYGEIRWGVYPPPILWRTIMEPLHADLPYMNFPDSNMVVSMAFCRITGDLAGPNCPTGSGWYKTRRLPSQCSGAHFAPSPPEVEYTPDPGGTIITPPGGGGFFSSPPSQQIPAPGGSAPPPNIFATGG